VDAKAAQQYLSQCVRGDTVLFFDACGLTHDALFASAQFNG
jgi:hypothetical protein